jgi:hypothetical protein
MYSAPAVPIANQRSGSSDSLSSVEGVWVVPRRFDARDQVASSTDNVEVSPPSISSSVTSFASSASPMSPPQPQVTMWSPEKAIDVAHIDYSNFIQQYVHHVESRALSCLTYLPVLNSQILLGWW